MKHVEVLSLKSTLRTCENYFTCEACGANSVLLQHALHHGNVRFPLLHILMHGFQIVQNLTSYFLDSAFVK